MDRDQVSVVKDKRTGKNGVEFLITWRDSCRHLGCHWFNSASTVDIDIHWCVSTWEVTQNTRLVDWYHWFRDILMKNTSTVTVTSRVPVTYRLDILLFVSVSLVNHLLKCRYRLIQVCNLLQTGSLNSAIMCHGVNLVSGVTFWTPPWLTWCRLNKHPELNLKQSKRNDTHTHTHRPRDMDTLTIVSQTHTCHCHWHPPNDLIPCTSVPTVTIK
jgi:hypothetical protein